MKRLYLLIFLALFASPVFSIEPGEILADPQLEERAREISKGLRCLVCQNESIDESDAQIAGDLRLLVRERLLVGDTDQAVVDYIVERYGEYVLLNPTLQGANWLLWLAGPFVFLTTLFCVFIAIKGQKNHESQPISEDDMQRLHQILDKDTKN